MAIASTFSSAPSRLIVSRSRPLRSMKRTASPMISSRPRLPLPAGVVTAVDVLVRARWRPIAPPRSGMVTPLQPSAKLTGEDLRSWPADRATSPSCHAEPWPICPRQTGGPPHLSREHRTPQDYRRCARRSQLLRRVPNAIPLLPATSTHPLRRASRQPHGLGRQVIRVSQKGG